MFVSTVASRRLASRGLRLDGFTASRRRTDAHRRVIKIAVNARGCNAAALLSFGRRMIAESPWNRYRFAASHHAVVTAGFLTGFATVGVTRRWELGGVNEG
jgi:hypothetical protein